MVSLNPAIKFLGIKDIGSNSNAPREKEILYKGCYETPTFKFAKETDWDKFIDFLKNKDSDDLINMGKKDSQNDKVRKAVYACLIPSKMRNVPIDERKNIFDDIYYKIMNQRDHEGVNNALRELAKLIPFLPKKDINIVFEKFCFDYIVPSCPKSANEVLLEMVPAIPFLHGVDNADYKSAKNFKTIIDNHFNIILDGLYNHDESANNVLRKLAANLDIASENTYIDEKTGKKQTTRKYIFDKICDKIKKSHPESANLILRELVTRIPVLAPEYQDDAYNRIYEKIYLNDAKSANGVLEKLAADKHYLKFEDILAKANKDDIYGYHRIRMAIADNQGSANTIYAEKTDWDKFNQYIENKGLYNLKKSKIRNLEYINSEIRKAVQTFLFPDKMENIPKNERKYVFDNVYKMLDFEDSEGVNKVVQELAKLVPSVPEDDINSVYDRFSRYISPADPKNANNALLELTSAIPFLKGDEKYKDNKFNEIVDKLYDHPKSKNRVLLKLTTSLDKISGKTESDTEPDKNQNPRRKMVDKILDEIKKDEHPESANLVRRELITRIPASIPDHKNELYDRIYNEINLSDAKSANGILEKLAADKHYLKPYKILHKICDNAESANGVYLALSGNLSSITNEIKRISLFKDITSRIDSSDAESAYSACQKLISKISVITPEYRFAAFKKVLKCAEKIEKDNIKNEATSFGASDTYQELKLALPYIDSPKDRRKAEALLKDKMEERKNYLKSLNNNKQETKPICKTCS